MPWDLMAITEEAVNSRHKLLSLPTTKESSFINKLKRHNFLNFHWPLLYLFCWIFLCLLTQWVLPFSTSFLGKWWQTKVFISSTKIFISTTRQCLDSMASRFPRLNQQITLFSFKMYLYCKNKNWFFNKWFKSLAFCLPSFRALMNVLCAGFSLFTLLWSYLSWKYTKHLSDSLVVGLFIAVFIGVALKKPKSKDFMEGILILLSIVLLEQTEHDNSNEFRASILSIEWMSAFLANRHFCFFLITV